MPVARKVWRQIRTGRPGAVLMVILALHGDDGFDAGEAADQDGNQCPVEEADGGREIDAVE